MEHSVSPSHVRDVTSEEFDEQVIRRSAGVPVLVDFWAPWCGPCRILGPVLERLAEEMKGAFELVKVDTQADPDLASRYRIQGIPAVKLFRNGKVVDEFVGALPERQIRAFLRPWCPSEADLLAAEGRDLLEAGKSEDARKRFETALSLDSGHAPSLLGLARLELAAGRLDAAEDRVDALPFGTEEHAAGQALAAAIELAREAAEVGTREECESRVEQEPSDAEAHWALGGHALAGGDQRGALERYLRVVEIDRSWRDEAGRRAMLTVFELAGARDSLAEEFRERLRRLLY